MSMTLEESILHAEEVAEKHELVAFEAELQEEYDKITPCKKYAAEHRQLAEWLKELAERRKMPEIIYCKECKHKGTKNCVANAWTTIFGVTVKDDFYCGLAERVPNE